MKVIIAEKRSLAKTVANALRCKLYNGDNEKLQDNDIVVCNAHGHLMELLDMDDYFDKKIPWGENLPFFPKQFRFRLKKDAGDRKLYKEIVSLINDTRCEEIICCGDADREGEVIVRLILNYGLKDKTKTITRLWLPSQTDDVIRQQMVQRKLDSEYDNLFNEGIARTYMDWLIGINLTRAISDKAGVLLRIGRVVCPIVIAIYERDMQIKNFILEKYYDIESDIDGLKLISKQKFEINEKAQAQNICDIYNSQIAVVTNVATKTVKKGSPKLFSLSKLQGVCGKKLKLSPNETLNIVQSLYEKALVTYPRTNTEYLAETEKDKIAQLLKIHDSERTVFKDGKSIFDDKKIESHSALTPTEKKANLSELSQKEKDVYLIIMNRFLSVFWKEDCLLSETEATIKVGNSDVHEYITVKGTALKQLGWMEIEGKDTSFKTIPNLESNQMLSVHFKVIEKQTQPPKAYTVETLGNYLVNPFKKQQVKSDEEEYKQLFAGCEIGTEATRGSIIEKAINNKYISLKNNVYHIEKMGIYLVETLQKLKIDLGAMRTVQLQQVLKQVYHNELSVYDSLQYTKNELNSYIANINSSSMTTYQKEQIVIGVCPWCGKEIYEHKSKFGVYYAHDNITKETCCFKIGTQIKVYGQEIKLTSAKIKKLLEKKGVQISMTSKKGSKYDVILSIKTEPYVSSDGKKWIQFNTEQVKSNKGR